MPKIVVPQLPDLPDEPRSTEPAHVCDLGWIHVPRGTRPQCDRCAARLEHYRHVAAGHGTVPEIREAISALKFVDGQPPLGQTVRVNFEGLSVWACPRSFANEDGEPVVSTHPNRAARRRLKLRKT